MLALKTYNNQSGISTLYKSHSKLFLYSLLIQIYKNRNANKMNTPKKISAKELFSKPIYKSIKPPIHQPLKNQPQTKQMPKKQNQTKKIKKKSSKEEEVIDNKFKIEAKSVNILLQKVVYKQPTIQFQKFQLKRESSMGKYFKKQLVQNEQTMIKSNSQIDSVQKSLSLLQTLKEAEQEKNQVRKQKVPGKSRAKIFKEQLIDTIPLQNKTSLHRWTYGEGITSSKLIIGNWNVNGIRSVLSKKMLYPYIHSHKPDILCITETKLDQKNFDSSPISLNGYHGYWNFPKHSSGYSGVAVFSKFLPKSVTEDMLEREYSQEGRILTLQFQKFMLINIYVPTVGKDLERIQYRKKYDSVFREHVNRVRAAHPTKPVIIAGDLNVAHTELDTHHGKQIMLTPSFTNIERQGLTELLNLGYTDVFRALHPDKRAYTWWYVNIGGRDRLDTPGLGRRIDYFLMPTEYMKWVRRCEILRQFYGADHCPVEIQFIMQESN